MLLFPNSILLILISSFFAQVAQLKFQKFHFIVILYCLHDNQIIS